MRIKPLKKQIFNPPIFFMTVLRIVSGLSILFYPLEGFIAFALIDTIDWMYFVEKGNLTYKQYHQLDKYLDWVGYVCMILVSFKFPVWSALMLLGFFVYRLIGQLIYFKTKGTRIFLLFPNFFEASFFWVIILERNNNLSLPLKEKYLTFLMILFIIQIGREFYLHLFCPWYMKRYRYPRPIEWIGCRSKNGYKHFWS